MGKRQISAKEVIEDIRSGFTGENLKNKYGLDQGSLESVLTKLKEDGFLTQEELDNRLGGFDLVLDVPTGRRPQPASVPVSACYDRNNANHRSRPPIVGTAVSLIYLSLGTSIFTIALLIPSFDAKVFQVFPPCLWLGLLFSIGFMGFVANRIGAGKNWARIVCSLVVLTSFSFRLLDAATDTQTFLDDVGEPFSVSRVLFLSKLGIWLLYLTATVMLFRRPAREWFATMKTGTSSPKDWVIFF